MKTEILYIDMDNVLVDFPSAVERLNKETLQEYEGRLDEVPSRIIGSQFGTELLNFAEI